MKARSVARELALLILFQLEKKDIRPDWERLSLQEMIVASVRTLTLLAQEQLEALGHELADLREFILDAEIKHPENQNIPVDEPTKPVRIPTTREMADKLETLLRAVDNLEEAMYLPEVHALSLREDVQNYCKMLVRNVLKHQAEIDKRIDDAATDWRVERMQKMDLALLRLAIAELCYTDSTDPATVIDEALELAKNFTAEESRKFIHGILGTVASLPAQG